MAWGDSRYTIGLKSVELDFCWDDTPNALQIINQSTKPFVLASARIINGAGTGSVTAGVVTLNTGNSDYVFTLPTTLAAGDQSGLDMIGEEFIAPDDVLSLAVTTKPGSIAAKSYAKLKLLYWGD